MTTLYNLKDSLGFYWQNPSSLKALLEANPLLLLEVIAIILVIALLLTILFRPFPKKELDLTAAQKTRPLPKQKTALGPDKPARPLKKPPATKIPASPAPKPPAAPVIQELSPEEELALHEAMAVAGKQALAEVTGAPHQIEFFPNDQATLAAKKMFARQKEKQPTEPASATKQAVPTPVTLVMFYFMAPRSHVFEGPVLFEQFHALGLTLNEHHVFEYNDENGLQFYVASALKPGTFDLHNTHYHTPGLSVMIDLQTTVDGKAALNKLLAFIHELSSSLKGDLLDSNRQRLTQNTINAYMAKIKSYAHLHHGLPEIKPSPIKSH